MKKTLSYIFFCLLFTISCNQLKTQTYPASDPALSWQGRLITDPNGNKWLYGSAACLRFRFKGDVCNIWLQNHAPGENYNYISFVIDGEHTQRIRINFDSLSPLKVVPQVQAEFHDVEMYKETEAKNGAVIVGKIEAESIAPFPKQFQKKIEFIGNSISAGMSSDENPIRCGQGTWYDQHNAYEAFGPIIARKLNCDFLVAAYSGLGIYRNWATDSPVMKDIYSSAALSEDPNSPRWDFHQYTPDAIVCCIGSNDLSDGDGVHPRLPFDATAFIESYLSFLQNIHQQNPAAKILLLNGPVNTTEKDLILKNCLNTIKRRAETEWQNPKHIELYFFPLINPKGCDGHPDLQQQYDMAMELEPVVKKLIE